MLKKLLRNLYESQLIYNIIRAFNNILYRKLFIKFPNNRVYSFNGTGPLANIDSEDWHIINNFILNLSQFANECIREEELQEKVDLKLRDYRDITSVFYYIVLIGMFEHVVVIYWQTYFKKIASHLKKGSKAMIQTIVVDENDKIENNMDGFITHYIFPGGCLPSHDSFINEAADKAGLICKESYAFGKDYAFALTHWSTRFDKQLIKIKRLGFSKKFIRCWRFYLSYARADFLSNRINVV